MEFFIIGNESLNKNTALNNTEKMTECTNIYIWAQKWDSIYGLYLKTWISDLAGLKEELVQEKMKSMLHSRQYNSYILNKNNNIHVQYCNDITWGK